MASTLTPNMNLIVPGVGTESGPTYALDLNASLSIIDQHNHTPGSGVQITPSGFNINTALTFNNNSATNLSSLVLVEQTTPPTGNGTIYESSAGDIHFINGAGLDIKITNSSGVNVSPTSIPGLTSPASVEYVPGDETFVWESDVNIAANMDFGSAILRNISPNSTFAVTLQPPPSLASNYTLTLPSPVAFTSFMVIDGSGLIAGTINVTNGITNNNIALNTILAGNISPTANILGSQLSASANIAGTQLTAGTITNTQINAAAAIAQTKVVGPSTFITNSSGTATIATPATNYTTIANQTLSITGIGRPIQLTFRSDNVGGVGHVFINGTAQFNYKVIDTNTADVISCGDFVISPQYMPLSIFNCTDTRNITGNIVYTLQCAAVNASSTVVNVKMIATLL